MKRIKKFFNDKSPYENLNNFCVDCGASLFSIIGVKVFNRNIPFFIIYHKSVFINRVYRCKTCAKNYKMLVYTIKESELK